MGMYNLVEPHDSIMPKQYRGLSAWQTKDAADCMFDILRITEEGRLILEESTYELKKDDDAFLGVIMNKVSTVDKDLNYHGDVCFYTFDGDEFIELVAHFTNGNLERVKEVQRS